eukprot:13550768-Alexandrium_andersonii.AAC.1
MWEVRAGDLVVESWRSTAKWIPTACANSASRSSCSALRCCALSGSPAFQPPPVPPPIPLLPPSVRRPNKALRARRLEPRRGGARPPTHRGT